jgi:hypothetical protein
MTTSTIKKESQFLSILETAIADKEYYNLPKIGFKAETSQTTLNKGRGKENTMLALFDVDTTQIIKHTSGTCTLSLGETDYKTVMIKQLLKLFKKESELPSSMSNAKVLEMIGNDTVSDYQPKARKWGVHIDGELSNSIVKHNEHYYLITYFYKSPIHTVKVTHTLNGAEFNPKDAMYSAFRKKVTESPNKVASEFFGVKLEDVQIRTYKLCNLKYFSCRGNKYEVDIPQW